MQAMDYQLGRGKERSCTRFVRARVPAGKLSCPGYTQLRGEAGDEQFEGIIAKVGLERNGRILNGQAVAFDRVHWHEHAQRRCKIWCRTASSQYNSIARYLAATDKTYTCTRTPHRSKADIIFSLWKPSGIRAPQCSSTCHPRRVVGIPADCVNLCTKLDTNAFALHSGA